MKRLAYICLLAVIAISACNKKDVIDSKVGVRLPPVTNLTLQELTAPEIKLTWTNPTSLPAEIEQPVKIFIEIREITGVMQSNPVHTETLENAPTEFTFALPDVNKKYIFTVKLNGTANVADDPERRYATNIFSLGETVTYN